MKVKKTWDEEDEASWRELTKRREDNKALLGVMSMCKGLRDLADRIEKGDTRNFENIHIEFLYHGAYGYERNIPYARKITLVTGMEGF